MQRCASRSESCCTLLPQDLSVSSSSSMARGQGKRQRRGQKAKMLQAVLVGATMSSTHAFLSTVRPVLSASSAMSSSGVRALSSAQVSNAARKAPLARSRAAAATAHGLHMVATGIEKGMFTTSSPEDRRVTPEFRDGKAYFKVSLH